MSKINVCPNCGKNLECQLISGISSCSNCEKVFDSSEYQVVLAAAWQARNQNFSVSEIQKHTGLDSLLAQFVFSNSCLSHEELVLLIHRLNKIRC